MVNKAVWRKWFRARWQQWRKPLLALVAVGGLLLCLLLMSLWRQSALVSPDATVLYTDRHGVFLSEADGEALGFWDVTEGGERVAQALIAVEDKRFQQHQGVDLRAIGRSLRNNLKGGPRQGASTLAMQVARMQGDNGRGYFEKAQEMAVATLLTWRHGRQGVLNHYLKIVPQGNRMHGVAYAARRYFQKPLADLSWAEASLLAALPKAPGRMNLYKRSGREAARQRATTVLARLREQGTINLQTEEVAGRQLAQLTIPVREVRPFNAYHAILRLAQLPVANSYSRPVATTLDLQLQNQLDTIATGALQHYRTQDAGNLGLVLLDRRSGDTLAYIGSDFYGDTENAGSIDYAATPRSSGSTLKPFLYGLGLEDQHYTGASIVDDLPIHITHKGGHYTARNYDEGYLGPVLYGRALANSRNIPALSVLRQVGLERAHSRLLELGLGDKQISASHYGLGLAIGGMYVTLEQLVSAYGTLANDGFAYKNRWLIDGEGGVGEKRIFPQNVTRQITHFLSDPSARLPGFPQLEFPFPVAIKTGTSQGFRDAWAVAYSEQYLLGIWVGHPDNLPMKELGGITVAQLAKQMMVVLHPQQVRGIDETPFPQPEGYVAVQVCPLSGELATSFCGEIAQVMLAPEQRPASLSKVHKSFPVDRRRGQMATERTPAEDVVLHHHVVLDPRYASWGRKHGYGPPPGMASATTNAGITVREPVDGGRFRLDPSIPPQFQTLSLMAEVTPAVKEVIWLVDGKTIGSVGYPYVTRWPLSKGEHRIEARFPNADISSQVVTISVN